MVFKKVESIKKIVSAMFLVFLLVQSARGTEVINAGVGGNNSRQMLSRLNNDVLSKQPNTVLILAGTNDMLNSGNSVSLAGFESNLKSIVNQISAINSKIVLMTIPPCIEEALLSRHDSAFYAPEGPNGRIAQANEIVSQIAMDNNLPLVDMNRIFSNNIALMSNDGVHPTPEGCAVMADSLYEAILENNFPTDKIICFGNSITNRYTSYLAKLFVSTGYNPSFEFLFDTDGDAEGWKGFGGGSFSVTSGNLIFTYGGATSGFELNPPSSTINVDKANFPYLAIRLSATPTIRRYMYCWVGDVKSWYLGKKNPPADEVLDAANIFYYDLSAANFPDVVLPDGEITRLIFNLETDDGSAMINVDWIKTFVSVDAIKAYAGLTTGLEDIPNQSPALILSGQNEITIQRCELDSHITMHNMFGGMVYRNHICANEVKIPCEKGVYILSITTPKGSFTEKVVVK